MDEFKERFSMDGNSNLFIDGTKWGDAGLYTCTEKDGYGTVHLLYHIVVKGELFLYLTHCYKAPWHISHNQFLL